MGAKTTNTILGPLAAGLTGGLAIYHALEGNAELAGVFGGLAILDITSSINISIYDSKKII